VMTFFRQVMSDLEQLQGDLAHKPATRRNDAPQLPAVEALIYS